MLIQRIQREVAMLFV